MPAEGSLKRLGGGRWETRDGRFAIEPQSGTWVVVDNTQTDDLGLPLVRGPFGSLTAAKAAIESARDRGPVESPLAERLKQAETTGTPAGGARPRDKAGRKANRSGAEADAAGPSKARPVEPAEPSKAEPPPEEPKWLRDLAPAKRRQARELIERLAHLDIADPESIARAEIARDQPAIAGLAIERAIGKAITSSEDSGTVGRAVVEAILRGKDDDLGARWRIVDDRGRRIDELDVSG
jgi:hypothetical protein